jgi:GntR family transcriptional regulator of vanillate catabolism
MSDQLNQVLLTLREEIATGRLSPAARIVEAETSKRLGVSRTPVRLALRLLEAEGLLEPAGQRGYRVRHVDEDRIRMAILARGAIEGLAVREIAIKGIDQKPLGRLRQCLADGDELLAGTEISNEQALAYNQMNVLFHSTIIAACRSDVLAALIEKCDNMPFAGVSYLAYDRSNPKSEHRRFQIAHSQHHVIVGAILQRDSARAEFMMREHANNALLYFTMFREGTVAHAPYRPATERSELTEVLDL